MKYKEIDMYNEIFSQKYVITQKKVITRIQKELTSYVGILNAINECNKIILNLELKSCSHWGKPINDRTITMSNIYDLNYSIQGDYDICLSAILFKADLDIFDSIKDLTYGDYIYQKLEMFNFVNMEI